MRAAWPSACAVLALVGCGRSSADTTPEGAIAAYAQALERGDAEAAYALLSPDYRKRTPEKEFESQVKRYQPETREAVERLSSRAVRVDEEAHVALINGAEVVLVREKDRWRIRTPVASYYDQSTPRAALGSFLEAMRHERWEVVLSLMPERARGDLTAQQLGENLLAQREELQRMLALLEASRDAPIEEVGERATMPYGERFAVRFVKEGDLWKIEDPE